MPLPIVCGLTSYCFISPLKDADAVSSRCFAADPPCKNSRTSINSLNIFPLGEIAWNLVYSIIWIATIWH